MPRLELWDELIGKLLPAEISLMLYKAYILPRLEYCSKLLLGINKTLNKKLESAILWYCNYYHKFSDICKPEECWYGQAKLHVFGSYDIHSQITYFLFVLYIFNLFKLLSCVVLLLIIIIVMRFIQVPPARILGVTVSHVVTLINWLFDWLIDWLVDFDWLAQTLERNNLITYQTKGQKVDNKI